MTIVTTILLKAPLEQTLQDLTADELAGVLADAALLMTAPESDPKLRAAAGRALGLYDRDNRSGIGLNSHGLPDVQWCDVPAGVFIMGSDKQHDPYAYKIEMPRREVEIPYAYRIARCPITYAQFQAFITSGKYESPEWWCDFPVEFQAQPAEEQVFRYTNHPCDNVSWYQAVAFCRWLTTKYHEIGLLDKSQEIRLPTEQEWEKAARGTDGRIYPYDDYFDPYKANISETGIGQTSAVGIFLEGVSPYGALDMSGNVYEWCVTKYAESENHTVDTSGDTRVMRGGSYFLRSEWSRCAHRYERKPEIQFKDFGFRPALVGI